MINKYRYFLSVWICLLLITFNSFQIYAQSLVGQRFDYQGIDSLFTDGFVDVDEWREVPVRHRYIHGGFRSNGTRFSMYLPSKEDFKHRFFQYITPFPDSETVCQNLPDAASPIGFAVSHGSYFLETNCGGAIDFTKPEMRDATIGAYRANAACAEFSRVVAQYIYGKQRIYGYCFGGSGGAYRTIGGIENCPGVWDGAVPMVMGSTMAIPNVFAVRMNALRVLKDKFPQIVDALEPGGSGDVYAGLNEEEKQVLQETTRMGFPISSWYAYPSMDVHGFLVLYKSVVMMDPTYFNHDFWNEPGYLGSHPTPSLLKARLQQTTTIRFILGQQQAEELQLVQPLSPEERGSIDLAWRSAGSQHTEKPVAFQVEGSFPEVGFMGGDLIVLSGKAKGQVLQITKATDSYVALAPTNALDVLAQLAVGDSVQVDNSNFLAAQTYYRHQVPTPDFYVWNQFRDKEGKPIYPQRSWLIGPMFTQGASGCLPTGNIQCKTILLCSLMDREAFPWQGDWYHNEVKKCLGDKAEEMFRLWYTDHGVHNDRTIGDDPTHIVGYGGIAMQALLDLSDWVERGIEPARSTQYRVEEGQVLVPATANERGGIQGVVSATILKGKNPKRADVKVGKKVKLHVVAEVPAGQGKVIAAEWCWDDSKEYTTKVDLTKAKYSSDGSRVEFDTEVRYDKSGTYFPTVRITSQRQGDAADIYTYVQNLDRVRVVVK